MRWGLGHTRLPVMIIKKVMNCFTLETSDPHGGLILISKRVKNEESKRYIDLPHACSPSESFIITLISRIITAHMLLQSL